MKGDRVRISSTTGPRGTVLESLRELHETKEVGTVEMGPDAVDWYVVKFNSDPLALGVPGDCMKRVA